MNAPAKPLPEYARQYLEAVPEHRPKASVDEERRVCEALWDTIGKEIDQRLQKLMTERFETYCRTFADNNHVLSYIYRERWEDETEEDRRLLARPLQLYWELEDIIARYADASGYTKQTGPDRYPLRVPRSDGTTDRMGSRF